jgi:two-component system, OmpR family, sensor kinase
MEAAPADPIPRRAPSARTVVGAGFLAGILAAVPYGVLLHLQGELPVLGALYGSRTDAAGWTAHLTHAGLLGVAYAAAAWTPLRSTVLRVVPGMLAGLVFGALTWLLGVALVLPPWASASGLPRVPLANAVFLAGHGLYGLVLGGLVPLLVRARSSRRAMVPATSR